MRLRILLILAALAACSRPAKVRITRVRVVDRSTSADVVRPGIGEAERIVRKALSSDAVTWEGKGKSEYRLRVEYSLDRAEVAGRGLLRTMVLLRLDPEEDLDAAPLESAGVFEHAYSSKKGLSPESVKRQLAQAVEGVGKGLHLQVALLLGSARELVRALSDSDPQVRNAAVRLASIRRERKAVPRLIELLDHSDERVSDAAIGALVAIGDRRAVRPLCERFTMGDVRGLAKVIDGIASLGGDEAQDFLELLASGHDDAAIRQMARAALERLRARR